MVCVMPNQKYLDCPSYTDQYILSHVSNDFERAAELLRNIHTASTYAFAR